MDKEHIKGAADKASGAAKDAIGKTTGNDKLRAEGAFAARPAACVSAKAVKRRARQGHF